MNLIINDCSEYSMCCLCKKRAEPLHEIKPDISGIRNCIILCNYCIEEIALKTVGSKNERNNFLKVLERI